MARVAQAPGRLPRVADGGRPPRPARGTAAGQHRVGQLDEWAAAAGGRGWFAEFAADATCRRRCGPTWTRRPTAAIAAVAELRRWLAAEYLPQRARAPRTGSARSATAPVRAPLDRRRPGPGGGLCVGLVAVPSAARTRCATRRSRCCPARPPWRPCAHLDEHGEAVDGVEEIRRLAAADDGRRHRRPGRHPFRPGRPDQGGRGADRPAGQRRRAVLHARPRRTSPGPGGPGCRRWAGPGSRSGT